MPRLRSSARTRGSLRYATFSDPTNPRTVTTLRLPIDSPSERHSAHPTPTSRATSSRGPNTRFMVPAGKLLRPQPAERPRRQQRVDQAIDNGLDRRAPCLPAPDGIDRCPAAIREEGRRPCHPKHGEITGARAQRPTGDVGDEHTDYQTVDEPLDEVLTHPRGPALSQEQHRHRALFELLDSLGGPHLGHRHVGDQILSRYGIPRPDRRTDGIF